MRFEKLVTQRDQEIKDQAKTIESLQEKAGRESEQRAHFEELAAKRDTELKECVRRQVEMNKDITLRVRQSQGQTTRITIQKSMELSRIFETVSRQKGMRPSDLVFTYKGKELAPTDTPVDLEMEVNSLIDVSTRRRSGGVGSSVRFM